MSWTEDIWSQNDLINNGYPFVTETGISEKYTHSSVKSVWTIQENENNGYPFISETGIAKKYNHISVKSIWRIDQNINNGYPYITTAFAVDNMKLFVGNIRVKHIFLGSKQVKIHITDRTR